MTRRTPFLATSLSIAALVAVFALPVAAKEGAVAALDAPAPIDGPPGATFQLRWAVFAVDESGARVPIGGSPIYARLIPPGGAPALELPGREDPERPGHYVANVTIPEGGIERLEIAMRGRACDASGCRVSDVIFPLVDAPAAVVSPGPPAADGTGPASATALAALVTLVTTVAIAAGLGAFVVGRRGATVRPDPA